MIGKNKLVLCQAEMLVAIQEYLDKRMTVYAPKAFTVEENKSEYSFVISIEGKSNEN